MDEEEIKAGCKKLLDDFSAGHDELNSRQDAGIQAEVWLALWQADDMESLDIGCIDVVVRQCEVWLQGQVEDTNQRQLAEGLVKAIRGVCACHNQLQVKPPDE